MRRIFLTLCLLSGSLSAAFAAQPDRMAEEEAAIRQAVTAYVAAYNRQDAQALAALWSPEAAYTDPDSGTQIVGREAIAKQFAEVFANDPGAKLEASTGSVRFVSPNVAVESGTAKIIRADQPAEESSYTAVYVKRDGKWLLDRVSEEDVPVVSSNYEKLKELEWMIGTWVDQDDQARVETTCQWTKNRNFMTRFFMLSVRDRIDMAGLQIVGWDPASGQIRSWVFDSDGGFGEGTWSRKGDSWYVKQVGTLPDGRKSSAVNIFKRIDDNTFTWQSINREAGGEVLPNVDEVLVVRQTAEQ